MANLLQAQSLQCFLFSHKAKKLPKKPVINPILSSTGQPDESYEDEVGAGGSVGAKMAGETLRGRYNSMSTIAGVRFDN